MKYFKKNRKFIAGKTNIVFTDKGSISLNENEMIALRTGKNKNCDITKTPFGFYLTSSLNRRLYKNQFFVVLTKNRKGKFFLLLVDKTKRKKFKNYLKAEANNIVTTLEIKNLKKIEKMFNKKNSL